jgi:hypothetical protein
MTKMSPSVKLSGDAPLPSREELQLAMRFGGRLPFEK